MSLRTHEWKPDCAGRTEFPGLLIAALATKDGTWNRNFDYDRISYFLSANKSAKMIGQSPSVFFYVFYNQ